MMGHLPKNVGKADENKQSDAQCGEAREEQAALRRAKERDAEGDQEERHGWLVEQANAGGDAEDEPPGALGVAAQDEQESEDAEGPEDRLPGVHGEEPIGADELRAAEQAQHGEPLRGAPASEGPGDETAKTDHGGAGEGGKNADGEDRVAEEDFTQARLQGYDGSVVDVPPGEVAGTGDVVELIAEVAVADVRGPEGQGEMQQEFRRGEQRG